MIPSQSIIKTEVIHGSTSRYIAHIATRWLERRWWTLLIPIAVPVALGLTVNQAWLLVAFMLLLLCHPSLLLLLLLSRYILRSQARKAVFSYSVAATAREMTITYFQLNDSDAPAPPAEKIVFDQTVKYSITRNGLTIEWGDTPYDFIFIPHEALQSRAESTLFIKWLCDCQNQSRDR